MTDDVLVRAPAKVNIGLNVLKKREDGYHNIESIFQTVGLFDELSVSLAANDGVCLIECPGMQLPESNTLTKAYHAFCSLTGIRYGIKVFLDKRIPAGGGLGGGSSDAAALLKALERLNGVHLTADQKNSIAAKVGSDVFFFLHCNESDKACALVSGRGEVVEDILPRNDLHFVLIFPDVSSSTQEAYALLDDAYNSGRVVSCPSFNELKGLYAQSVEKWTFANSFTPALVDRYPVIGEALRDIKEFGADWSEMSGSGATVFGVFKTQLAAQKAVLECQKKWKCVIAH